jgi:hypothetical protein
VIMASFVRVVGVNHACKISIRARARHPGSVLHETERRNSQQQNRQECQIKRAVEADHA